MENLKFEEMNLSYDIVRAVKDMGFEEATPIQSQAISVIMEGKDIIGQSQTGTGKTAAFGLPCLEMLDPDNKGLQALILCPTRELAIQVSEEFRKFLKYKENIKVLPIYGGQPIDRQITALKKGVQVIIGTPGRVMDHMRRHTIKMNSVKYVVLDEADEMLDMGFRDDIETIMLKVPEERQTVMFSATMSQDILDLSRRYMTNPEYIKITRKELTVPSIEQAYFDVKEKTKPDALCRIIDMYNPKLSIVFCNTKKRVDEVVEQLQGRGYFAEALHGDLKQPQRDKVMQKFRNGTIEILVATDVAARGIDVDDVDIVFNYDVPQDDEYYVHRIGRTGRAGREGIAFNFVVGREVYKLRDIQRYCKTKIIPQAIPSLDDITEIKAEKILDQAKEVLADMDLNRISHIIEKKLLEEDYTSLELAAALLRMNMGEENEDIIFDNRPARSLDDLDSRRDRSDRGNGRGRRDGKGRDSRGGRGARKNQDDADMARLFINIGKEQKVKPGDILGAIAGESGISGRLVGSIDMYDKYTFVEVPQDCAEEVLECMKNARIKGKSIHMEPANGR